MAKMVSSMDRWRGKVAIVTGASAGIGASIAEKLVEEGLIVAGLARRFECVEALAKKYKDKTGKLHAVKCDVSKKQDILEAFRWVTDNLGPVHILINNAGIAHATSLIDGDDEKWRAVLDINVMGLCIATREAIKVMKDNKIDGHIVNINSIMGHGVPNIPSLNVYPASKYAVTALTETLRQELNRAKLKIKITSVSPGFVDTEITVVNNVRTAAEVQKLKDDGKPFLESEDIADSILYVLATLPHVQVHELTIKAMGEPV